LSLSNGGTGKEGGKIAVQRRRRGRVKETKKKPADRQSELGVSRSMITAFRRT